MAYDPNKPNLPAMRPWISGQPQSAMASVEETCRMIVSIPEDRAWHMVQAIVHAAVADGGTAPEIFKKLTIVHDCRQWPVHEAEMRQLLARFRAAGTGSSSSAAPRTQVARYVGPAKASLAGRPAQVARLLLNQQPGTGSSTSGMPSSTPTPPGDSGSCDCKEPKKVPPMSMFTPTPSAQDFSSSCGGYRQPDPAATGLKNLSSCDVSKCSGGTRIGLEMIPYQRLLVPGVLQSLSFGFTRPSRLVAIAFTRRQLPTATNAYNPDDIVINNWRTSSLTQAYDIARNDVTFAGIDVNTAFTTSLINYFEDGDDSWSPIVHGQSPLPRFIPATDIGTNQGSVTFDILLDANVVGNQTVFFWAYVIFTNGG